MKQYIDNICVNIYNLPKFNITTIKIVYLSPKLVICMPQKNIRHAIFSQTLTLTI